MTNQKRTFSCIKYLRLCCTLCMLRVLRADEYYFQTRSNATFGPETNGKPESILWKLGGNKVVEYENRQAQWYRLGDKANLNEANGKLTLINVNGDFNGTYECELEVTERLSTTTYTIYVIDPVPKPKVTCLKNGSDIQLHCSLDPPVQATFTWSGPDNYVTTGSSIHLLKQLDDEIGNELYICTAENKVSKNNADFKLKDCTQPDELGQNHLVGVIVGVVIVVIILVCASLAAYKFWKKNSERDVQKNGDDHEGENLKSYASTSSVVGETVENVQMPETHCDASTQWEDLTVLDHSYAASESHLPLLCDQATQYTEPAQMHADLLRHDHLSILYTTVSLNAFNTLADYLTQSYNNFLKLHPRDQLLMTRMKRQLNLLQDDIVERFHVSQSIESKVISCWLDLMEERIVCYIPWLPRETSNNATVL